MATTIGSALLLLFPILLSHFLISSARPCSDHKFTSDRVYSYCKDLPYLHAHLHWNYNSSTGEAQIAYRARQDSHGWVSWAINPNDTGMVGSQALVAYHNSDGSMAVYTTPITSYSPSMLPGDLSFKVSDLTAEYLNNEIIIYAALSQLAAGPQVNHVWQAGSLVFDDIPQMHPVSQQHLQSVGKLDFLSS